MGPEEIVDAYLAAWNEADPGPRRVLLGSAVSDDCTLVAPTGTFRGIDAVDGLIVALRERMAGTTIARTGAVAVSAVTDGRCTATFGWQVRTSDGNPLLSGTDEVELAADGRLQSIHVAL